MRKIACILAIATLILAMAGLVLAQGKSYRASAPIEKQAQSQIQGQPQTVCPVRGGNIDKNVYADYKGQRVYFCCKGCDEEFKKNPEQYLKKMKSQGVTPEKCPASPAQGAK